MKATKLTDRVALSDVGASTSSHTTASAGEPTACRSARRAVSESEVSTVSSAIEPTCSSPSTRRSARMTLASSRDVGEHEVAVRSSRHSREVDDVADGRGRGQRVERALRELRRDDEPQVHHRRSADRRSPDVGHQARQ
jgi:hypothetical protein